MNFIVLFEDNTDLGPEIRKQHLPAHLDFLKRNAATIATAGPLAEVDGTPAGGIWIVAADNADAVNALIKEDPFWPTGLRKSVRILAWTKVFADGEVLI